jgi:hypothetical protein
VWARSDSWRGSHFAQIVVRERQQIASVQAKVLRAEGPLGENKMPSETLLPIRTEPLAHMISLPSAASESSLRPVLCFLHGYGEAAPMPIRKALSLHGPLRSDNSPRVAERFIVVAPQLPTAGDHWVSESTTVRQIVTGVQREFRGDPKRSYLTGFSFGGNGVFDIAIAQPDIWAALWSVDPTRPPGGPLPSPLWLSVGPRCRRHPSFIRLMSDTRDVQSKAGKSNHNFVVEDVGGGHVYTARVSYERDRVYDWLLTKTRT